MVNIDNFKPRDSMKWYWIVVAFVGLWLASGFYQVQPAEQGIVLRFGAYQDTTFSGLHYHLPYPIETVKKVNVTQERSITVGVSEMNNSSFTESHMLTGDENIVDINLTIVWTVKNAKDYLFNMRSPDETVRVAAQSVLREIVGQSNMQDIITSDRGKIEDDTKLELQKVLNEFQSGIEMQNYKKRILQNKLLMRLMKYNVQKQIWKNIKMKQKLIVMKSCQKQEVLQSKAFKTQKLIKRVL